MVEEKAFPANLKLQDCISQCGEHDCRGNNKKIKIIMRIQVCLISRMNFNYEENGVKKSFSWKSKTSISCITMRRIRL